MNYKEDCLDCKGSGTIHLDSTEIANTCNKCLGVGFVNITVERMNQILQENSGNLLSTSEE